MQQQVLSPGGEIFIWERRSGIIGKDEAGVYCQGATTRLSRLFVDKIIKKKIFSLSFSTSAVSLIQDISVSRHL